MDQARGKLSVIARIEEQRQGASSDVEQALLIDALPTPLMGPLALAMGAGRSERAGAGR